MQLCRPDIRILYAVCVALVLAFASVRTDIRAPVWQSFMNPAGLVWTTPSLPPEKVKLHKQHAFDRREGSVYGITVDAGAPFEVHYFLPSVEPTSPHSGFADVREWVSALAWGAVAVALAGLLLTLSGLSIPETVLFPGITR